MQRKQPPKTSLKKGAVPTPSSKTRRGRKKSIANLDRMSLYKTQPSSMLTPGATSLRLPGSTGKKAEYFKLPRGLTADGLSFLKCAFAPPDFAYNMVAGVPDAFEGSSLVKKHRGVYPLVVPSGRDRYMVLLPTPGYAYWYVDVLPGVAVAASDILIGVPYSDFDSMFDPLATSGTSTDDVVNKFRYISNHIEMVPTVNATSWTGSIQCWKAPITVIERPLQSANTSDFKSVSGLQALNASNANQYTAGFNLGVFAGAYSVASVMEFQSITSNTTYVPSSPGVGDFGVLGPRNANNSAVKPFTGLDNNFEAVIIKISATGANANNSYLLKTWACVEYQVVTGTSLYEYMSVSPCDPVAMKLYREIIKQLPIATTYADNDTFWERVLQIIRMVSGGLSFLPGPYGQIASGVNAATTLLL